MLKTKLSSSVMKDLFFELYNAHSEEDALRIVMNNPVMLDSENWLPYGGSINNFGTFDNQQSEPVAALVEKITNSIDAILMKECRLRGIDPKSTKAPRTMEEAVEKFFEINSGQLDQMSHEKRWDLCPRIQVIATGSRQSPNLVIYDEGEGQHPDDFMDTFLSLQRGNKADIHFVQGKFNMGSTGAVIFCGEYKYQLIASKRCDDMNNKDSNEFGWTLVRRHILSESEELKYRSTWYEFFAPNGEIPRFDIDELELGLYNRQFKTGTIVKLFSYELPSGLRSAVSLELWRKLNMFLYQPALPILLCERRDYAGHANQKPMLGNRTRIGLDRNSQKEVTLSVEIGTAETGIIPIDVTVFKSQVDKDEFIGENSVVFTLNGQVQGSLPRRFISQDLKLQMLMNHMLVHVDCSKMNRNFQQDLFMGSRDRLKQGSRTKLLVKMLKDVLGNNETLKELDQQRRSRLMHENKEDKDILKQFISNASASKELLELIKRTGDVTLPKEDGKLNEKQGKTEGKGKEATPTEGTESEEVPFVGKKFPTFLSIVEPVANSNGAHFRSIHAGSKGVIKFETDVENEYFVRSVAKGVFNLQITSFVSDGNAMPIPERIEDLFDVVKAGPYNGSIRVSLKPKASLVKEGDVFEVVANLSTEDDFLEAPFYVNMLEPKEEDDKKKERDASMPQLVKVYKKALHEGERTWEDYNWTDGELRITDLLLNNDDKGDEILDVIAVNMDAAEFHNYLSKNKKRLKSLASIEEAKRIYYLISYFDSWSLYEKLNRILKDKKDASEIVVEEIVSEVQKDHVPLLMSLIDMIASNPVMDVD